MAPTKPAAAGPAEPKKPATGIAEAELTARFDHHPPANGDVADTHAKVRDLIKRAARGLGRITESGREQSLMLTALEEATYWANAAVARHHPDNVARDQKAAGK